MWWKLQEVWTYLQSSNYACEGATVAERNATENSRCLASPGNGESVHPLR